jgi:DNA (cytosine-5)-methyltransferase 1
VLDAQHFGVPQRRRRVFFVGHLGVPWPAPAEVLFECESGDGDSSAGREAGPGVAGSTAWGAGVASRTGGGLAPTLTARYRKGIGRMGDDPYVVEDGPDTHTHTHNDLDVAGRRETRLPDRRRISSRGTPHRGRWPR